MISRDQFQSKILEPILSSEVTNNSNVHKKNGKILAILTGPLRDKIIERPSESPVIDSSVLMPGEIVNYNISPYSVDAIVISKNKEGELEESGTLVPDNIITLGALLTELGLKDHNYNMEMQENPMKTPAIIVSGGGSSTQVMINGVENLNELIAQLSSQLKITPGTEFTQDLFFGSIGSLTNPVNPEIVETAIQRLKVIAAFLDVPVIFFIGNFGRLFINDISTHPILLPGEIPEGLKPFEAPNKFDKRNDLLNAARGKYIVFLDDDDDFLDDDDFFFARSIEADDDFFGRGDIGRNSSFLGETVFSLAGGFCNNNNNPEISP